MKKTDVLSPHSEAPPILGTGAGAGGRGEVSDGKGLCENSRKPEAMGFARDILQGWKRESH